MDVATGAAVADDNAISTVVPPPSLTKREGAYVGVLLAFKGACVGGRGRRGRPMLSPPPRFPDVAKLPLLPQSCRRHRHHRHYTVAPLSPPQMSRSRCLPAAAAKLMPLPPPPCHAGATALLPLLPSCPHCHRCLHHCHTLRPPATSATAAVLPLQYCHRRRQADSATAAFGIYLLKLLVILLLGKVVLAPNQTGEEYGFLNRWREE